MCYITFVTTVLMHINMFQMKWTCKVIEYNNTDFRCAPLKIKKEMVKLKLTGYMGTKLFNCLTYQKVLQISRIWATLILMMLNHVGYLIVTDGEEVYVFTDDEAYQDWQQVNRCWLGQLEIGCSMNSVKYLALLFTFVNMK